MVTAQLIFVHNSPSFFQGGASKTFIVIGKAADAKVMDDDFKVKEIIRETILEYTDRIAQAILTETVIDPVDVPNIGPVAIHYEESIPFSNQLTVLEHDMRAAPIVFQFQSF